MKSYSNYLILPDKKLIIERFSGKIGLDNILELKQRESFEKDYDPNFNIIDDSRDAEFVLNKRDILKYIDHLSKTDFFIGKRNAAYLTQTPNQVVITTLFAMLKKELPINVKIVSTIECALNWVGVKYSDRSSIKHYLQELRKINSEKLLEESYWN